MIVVDMWNTLGIGFAAGLVVGLGLAIGVLTYLAHKDGKK